MGAVAIRRVAGILATAQKRHLRALRREHQGLDPGTGMRAVAEGLLPAPPAAAPGIAFALFQLHLIGAQLWTFRLF